MHVAIAKWDQKSWIALNFGMTSKCQKARPTSVLCNSLFQPISANWEERSGGSNSLRQSILPAFTGASSRLPVKAKRRVA